MAFETEDADLSPFFDGLPDQQCQVAHRGYVFEGRAGLETEAGEETFEAGNAYYIPPARRRRSTPSRRSSSSDRRTTGSA